MLCTNMVSAVDSKKQDREAAGSLERSITEASDRLQELTCWLIIILNVVRKILGFTNVTTIKTYISGCQVQWYFHELRRKGELNICEQANIWERTEQENIFNFSFLDFWSDFKTRILTFLLNKTFHFLFLTQLCPVSELLRMPECGFVSRFQLFSALAPTSLQCTPCSFVWNGQT